MLRTRTDELSSMNLDYIAGFFDGEGSVSLQFHRMPSCKYGYQFLPAIIITQKNRQIIEAIQSFLKVGRLYPRRTGVWNLEVRKQSDIRKFISDINSVFVRVGESESPRSLKGIQNPVKKCIKQFLLTCIKSRSDKRLSGHPCGADFNPERIVGHGAKFQA